MGKIGTFFFGVLIGGVSVWWMLHFHVVRAADGLHIVPKVTSAFAGAYVDIRSFGINEWAEHQELAFAISRAQKQELLQGAPLQTFQNAVNQAFDQSNARTTDRR